MAIYGQQDAMRPEHREELQELVVVRGFGDEFDRHFFVKTMRPDLRPPAGSKAAPASLFLESARTQQRVADAGSRNWATVHMAGTGPKGPYVVLNHYPHSAKELVKNKVTLSPRALHRIATGVVDGLIDLQRVSDRPHGNLKPSNVLLGPGDIENADVVLTDPAPLEQLATQGRGDAYDLGQLIHCLVLQRRFTGNWPIEASAGWTTLGGRGKGWRELCNKLLNPNPDKRPRVRQIRSDLAQLQPNRSAAPRVVVATALGAFVLAAGAAFYVYDPLDLRTQSGPAGTAQNLPATRPTTVPPVVPPRTETTGVVTPATQATVVASAELTKAATPPVGTAEEKVVTPPVGTAEVTVEAPKIDPVPDVPPAIQLPAGQVAQVRNAQASFASRGWVGQSGYLEELTTRLAKPQPEDAATLESAAALVAQIEKDWSAIAQAQETLGAIDDRILKTYAAAVGSATAAGNGEKSPESLRALAASLRNLANDADWSKVVAYVQSPEFKNLDVAYFAEASEAHRNFGEKPDAAAGDLRAWLADARSGKYARLDPNDDPRRQWAAAEQLQRLRTSELPRLAQLAPPNAAADAEAAELQKQLQAVESRLAAVQKDLPWDRRNERQVREGVNEINETLARLGNDLKQAIARRESDNAMASARAKEQAERDAELAKRQAEVKEFLGGLERTTVSAVPAIQQEWQAHVQTVASNLGKDPAQFAPQARQAAADFQRHLGALDAAYRALPAPAPAGREQPQWAKDVLARVSDVAGARRETFLNDALAAARSQGTLEQAQAQWKRLADDYNRWLTESQGIVSDLAAVQSLLAAGYTGDEKPDATTPTVREMLARLERNPLWKDEQVQAAAAPAVQPVLAAESSDWRKLLDTAAAEEMPLGPRLAAWERLGATNHPWPANQQDLTQNLQLADDLRAAVKQQVRDAERLNRLSLRVEQPGRRNWERFLTRAASQADVEFALRLKDRYVGNDVTPLDRRSQFNAVLHDLRRLLAEADKDPAKRPELQPQITRIRQAIAALPADLSSRADLAPLVSALRSHGTTSSTGAVPDFSRLGPASVRGASAGGIPWTFSHNAQTQTVTYVAEVPATLTSDPPEIVFQRVEGDGRTPPFYLSTTEVSVGLFGSIINAAGKSAEFENRLSSQRARGPDTRVGPRSWYWRPFSKGAFLTYTRYWYPEEAQHYAPQLADSQNRSLLREEQGRHDRNPSNRHPMQHVSPHAADFFANLLGCRLQTPQEWQAASTLAPTANPNVRDQTWRAQYQWAADARATRYLPDRGIFMPPNENPSREVWTEAQLAGRPRSVGDRVYNDGDLFFDDVAPGGGQTFNHLVGNVAEYAAADGQVYVIGASALSPPTRPIDQPIEVTDWRDAANQGYSDVGFRLAFSAPPAPYDQLRLVLEKQPYLTPGNPTTRPIAASE